MRYTMSQGFTSQMARNIFYGGTRSSCCVCGADFSHRNQDSRAIQIRGNHRAVVRGKHLWETRNCIGCHTLLGEGAYFAPELGNVYERRGPDFIKGWIKAMPTQHARPPPDAAVQLHRRTADDLVEFLRWTNGINTEKWPPNIEG
jgi:nitric oxide reductase subunit C